VKVEQEQLTACGELVAARTSNGLEERRSEGDGGGGVARSPGLVNLPTGIVERERQRDTGGRHSVGVGSSEAITDGNFCINASMKAAGSGLVTTRSAIATVGTVSLPRLWA
jgi:hypothetical protein